MTDRKQFNQYWELVHLFEDSIRGEFRESHPDPPLFRASPPAEKIDETSLPRQALSGPELIGKCGKCGIALARRKPVRGTGPVRPAVMIVLDPPSYSAEQEGQPLSGRERGFLGKWLEAIGLDAERDIYLTNIMKCRVPGDRTPMLSEISGCLGIFGEEVDSVQPKALLVLSECGGQALSGLGLPVSGLRKTSYQYRGVFTLVSYPPSMVLEDEGLKRPVWEDLKNLRNYLDGQSVS
jgi:DNA polymerase